jgi:hypothetical protein
MTVLRCPVNHAHLDPPAEGAILEDWAEATSWDNVREGLLAGN